MYSKEILLWNKGFVKYVNHMGDDNTPLIAARMSTQNETGIDVQKDNNLRDYLWRHKHTSVFEQIELVVEVKVPIFIARQIVRHRTFNLNEFSMRYSEPLHDYYVPDESAIRLDDAFNKQGSGDPANAQTIASFIADSHDDAILNTARYEKYRKLGVAKERVRDFQPVSAYTKLILKCDLRNWFHFLGLRLKPDAQIEIRQMSEAVYEIIKDLFPLCAGLFEEYSLSGETLSKTEMEILKSIIQDYFSSDSEEQMLNLLSGSRLREFKQKFGI